MITDGKKSHDLAAKELSALRKGITSNHVRYFYCLNCFHLYTMKNKLKNKKNMCNNNDYSYIEIPIKDNRILKYNHTEKSMKVPFVIYADLESLLEKNKRLS